MEKFAKLGFSKDVLSVLKKTGFEIPTEIQEKAIPLAIAGKDIVGGSATGSGKTLVFAAPIVENIKHENGIRALILTPTRELAEQVSSEIRKFAGNKKINVLAIYGGVNIETQIKNLFRADVVVGTPGRILDHLNRRTISLDKVKILVLDECDRMLDMGFHKDVEKIIQHCPKKRQTMLFSATVSADIDYLIKKYTNSPATIAVNSYIDASQLKQVYYDVPDSLKFSLLVHLLKKENSKLVMVFCNTRRNTDFVVDNLNYRGINAQAIHGGMEQKKRIRILEDFHKSKVDVLVCTDVAARGLDIKRVTHVYNYDLPKDSKDYIHRIGRTARAGKNGKVINILTSRDYENFSAVTRDDSLKITEEKVPDLERVRLKIDDRKNSGRNFNRGNFNRDRTRSGGRNFSRNRDNSRGNRNDRNRRDRNSHRQSFSRGRTSIRASHRY